MGLKQLLKDWLGEPAGRPQRRRAALHVESLEDRSLMAASLSIQDAATWEGAAGIIDVQMRVVLSEPATQAVTVKYSTADGSAKKSDYMPASGTLTFAPGETVLYISLQIRGDAQIEADEWFNVRLTEAFNADIADAVGAFTIWNDDYRDPCKPHDRTKPCG